jgi:hypothetical protein
MTRRLFNLLTLPFLLVCVASLTLWVLSYVAGTQDGPLLPSNAAVQDRLAAPLPLSNVSEARLDDVIRFLEDVSGVPVSVNWGSLSEAGVEPNAPVNPNVGGVRVGEALAAVLKEGGGAVFVTRGDGVYITTRSALDADPQAGPAVITRSVLPLDPRLCEAVVGGQRWAVAADRGVLKVWRNPADPAAAYQPARPGGAPSAGGPVALGNFMVGRFGYPSYAWQASVPFWAVALSGVLPLVRLTRSVRCRRARRAGLCGNCGYDLRASPGRCPECGTIPGTMPTRCLAACSTS